MRLACAFVLLLFLGAAPRPTVYHVELKCDESPCSFPIAAVIQRYARLQTYVTRVRVAIDPAPAAMPPVTWHVSDSSHLTVTHGNPFEGVFHFPGDTATTSPLNPLVAMLVPGHFEGNRFVGDAGAATVSVEIGPPVNTRLLFPVFAYHSLELGCYFASWNGISFGMDVPRSVSTPQESDVYVTGPTDPRNIFNNCGPKFAGDSYVLHAPYGARIVSGPFDSVRADAWRDDFREMPLQQTFGVLIAKTRTGQIFKLDMQSEQMAVQGKYLVASAAGFADNAPLTARLVQQPLHDSTSVVTNLRASIVYRDPPTATYGPLHTLIAITPWSQRLPFYQTFSVIGIDVSPQPYAAPAASLRIKGDTATVDAQSGLLRGVRTGRSTLNAQIGPPVSSTLSIPVATYDSLFVACGAGVRFNSDGTYQAATAPSSADLYISAQPDTFSCQGEPQIFLPGGGVFLSNGNDPSRAIVPGAKRGSQFPEISAMQWRSEVTSVDIDQYRRLIGPCTIPESPGVERVDYGCTTMSANVLLFRTRDGRYVKWLLSNGYGLRQLAGAYQVL